MAAICTHFTTAVECESGRDCVRLHVRKRPSLSSTRRAAAHRKDPGSDSKSPPSEPQSDARSAALPGATLRMPVAELLRPGRLKLPRSSTTLRTCFVTRRLRNLAALPAAGAHTCPSECYTPPLSGIVMTDGSDGRKNKSLWLENPGSICMHIVALPPALCTAMLMELITSSVFSHIPRPCWSQLPGTDAHQHAGRPGRRAAARCPGTRMSSCHSAAPTPPAQPCACPARGSAAC